jgi:hypothetical protein
VRSCALEAIGQALFYGLQTGRRPRIVLIIESLKDHKHWIRLNTTIQHYALLIDAHKIEKDEKMEPADLTGFIRQKRSLIIISLILLFYYTAGVEFEKITVSGAQMTIKNHNSIPHFLWTFWGYFFWRYYQYFNITTEEKRRLSQSFINKLALYAQKMSKKEILKRYDESDFDVIDPINISLSKKGIWHRNIRIAGWLKGEENLCAANKHNRIMDILVIKLIPSMLLAAVHVTFRTPYFTEFLMPFVIGASPLLYLIFFETT